MNVPSTDIPGANSLPTSHTPAATLARYLLYPVALSATLVYIWAEAQGRLGPLGLAYPIYLALMIGTMVALERLVPLRPDWNMSKRSFFLRDLPMLLLNGATIAATAQAITWLAARAGAGHAAPPLMLPWWAEAGAAILISDGLWYWVHRSSHEGRGRWAQWLWKTHVLHHLPEQVYVFMHVVGHPINTAGIRVIVMVPAILLGFSAEGVFAASVLTGLQGLVSHFNVDIRAGWLNRIFMGTELHRYHHSAAPGEGKNYAAVVSIWDQLFGTFIYHPGQSPARLGLHDPQAYPADGQWLRWLMLPFSRN